MLTSAQQVDVRRFLGYSVSGDSTSFDFRELIYSSVSYMGLSIDYRLEHLTSDEENILTTVYLPNLIQLEADITGARANLDTDQAAVWFHNKREVADRTALFNKVRRDLCTFLGFAPGPTLGDGSVRVSRC